MLRNTFFLFCLCFSLSGVPGVCSSQAQAHGRHEPPHLQGLRATALPEIMAKVQRKPTQGLCSICNCAAEAGMAGPPRRLWDGTMTGCGQLCRPLGSGRRRGGAEARQVVAFIFATPGRTHYCPLQYDRANSAFLFRRGLQHWLHEIRKVSSSLPAPNAIRTTSCSVVSQVPYYFHAWPPKFYQRCFICSQ